MQKTVVVSFASILFSWAFFLIGCDLAKPQSAAFREQEKSPPTQTVPQQTKTQPRPAENSVPPIPAVTPAPEPTAVQEVSTDDWAKPQSAAFQEQEKLSVIQTVPQQTKTQPRPVENSVPPIPAVTPTPEPTAVQEVSVDDGAKPQSAAFQEQEKPSVTQTVPQQTKTQSRPVENSVSSAPAVTPLQKLQKATNAPASKPTNSDRIIARLFADKKSDVQVKGEGVVTRLLSDDNKGDRHQRFIVTLGIGQTLLIAHNIDIAPRLDGIAVGDKVEFFGEYYYDAKGGGIHWTHRDPRRRHVDGWLKWKGKVFK